MFVVGIDAGGTKTVGYLADEQATVVAEARGPGANLLRVGEPGVETTLRQIIAGVMPHDRIELAAVCLGMAGVDRPQEASVVRAILDRIVKAAGVVAVNDALIALEAGAPNQAAIVIVSGTGSIAYGRDDRGRAARAGGWGYVLADEGSGYWLGRQALRAVMRQADGRGPATALTPRLLEHYQATRGQDLARRVYAGTLNPAGIASLAADVQIAADEGDTIAATIITVGATELAIAGLSVAQRLELQACPVILAGGIFRAVPRMRAAVTDQLAQRLPHATVRALEVEPALGAVHLALRVAQGQDVSPRYVD